MNNYRPEIPQSPRTAPPPVLVAQLLLAASMAMFLAIMLSVLLGKTQGADEYLLLALRSTADLARPLGPAWMIEVMRAFTALGTGLSLTAVVLLGLAWFYFRGDRMSMGMLSLVGGGGFLINMAIKLGVDRARPDVVAALTGMDPWSFPSGHAMMTLAIYLALAVLIGRGLPRRQWRTALIIVAITLSAIIGFSRNYLGVHYPSDVVAGWLLGLAWACTCWLVSWKVLLRRLPQGK